MKRRNEISTIDDLITALGGPLRLSRVLHVSQSAVSLWKIRETIPAGWHVRLLIEAEKRGLVIAPALFRIEGEDAKVFTRIFRKTKTALNGAKRPRASGTGAAA